jgi:hypothetical protein
MGYSSIRSQGLSAPPYLLAFVVVLLTAYLSDRYRNRSFFICFHAALSACGYTVIAFAGMRGWDAGWRYIGTFPATIGFFSVITIIITWTINNQDTDSKKGTGMVILQVIGQCGPFVGLRLFPDSDGPFYVKGLFICAVFMVAVIFLALCLRFYLRGENRKKEGAYERIGERSNIGEGSHSAPFKYIL